MDKGIGVSGGAMSIFQITSQGAEVCSICREANVGTFSVKKIWP